MKNLLRFIVFVLMVGSAYAQSNFAQSSITYTHLMGGVIAGNVEFRQKQLLGQDKVVKIPLPPGEWNVRLVKEVKSTGGSVQIGVLTVLDQVIENRAAASLWLNLYPNANINWTEGNRCSGDALRRALTSQISDYCHSLRVTNYLVNRSNTTQAEIRQDLNSRKIAFPTQALTFSGFIEQRGDFTLYYDLYVDPRSMGIEVESVNSEKLVRSLIAEINNGLFKNIDIWYLGFAKSLAESILKEKLISDPSVPSPGSISNSLRNAWMNFAEVNKLTINKSSTSMALNLSNSSALINSSDQGKTRDAPTRESIQLVGSAEEDKLLAQRKIDAEIKKIELQQIALEAQKKDQARIAQEARQKEQELKLAEQRLENQQRLADESRIKEQQRLALEASEINRLRAEAEESKRKQAELEEQLKLAKLKIQVSPPSATTTMANRKALIIGNDTYKSVSKLLNAREDAKAIASNLTAVGYKVTLQLDLNEKEMKTALRTFSSQVQGGDEVMFFFAGHGVQLGAANYLLPTDIGSESEAQVKDEAIQLQRILDDMTEKKAKFTLAMIDACRDNPFKSTGRNIGGRGLAPTTAATGQMVVFSAGTGQQALDRLGNNDKNKNGVFTRTFLKEMQKPGISIDRIVKNVRNEVAELAKTVGHEQVPAIYDQVLGDFYFKN